MIETVYNEDIQEEETIKLPKNIHQIGSGETKYHIYIEDKVSEFLQLLPENEKNIRYGVLLGSARFSKGEIYLFIREAVEVREILENTLLFGDDVWTGIYDDIKKYYRGEKIIGWYASLKDFQERDLFQIRKLHLDHFAGNDKVFLNVSREEEELDFYVYSGGDLQKILCYHIYYEKNQALEEYIFETHYDLVSRRRSAHVKSEKLPKRQEEEKLSEDTGMKAAEKIEKTDEKQQETDKTEKKTDIYHKVTLFSGKAASAFVIGALLLTVGVMYKKGQLDNLTTEMKEVVAGIMNQSEEVKLDDIVLLDDSGSGFSESRTETEEQMGETEQAEQTEVTQTEVTQTENTQTETEETADNTETAETQGTEEQTTETQLPAITAENPKYYTVQQGDTLYGICKTLYGNIDNIEVIMSMNQLDSADDIPYGKTLIVP
jgi:LysM repeat protein